MNKVKVMARFVFGVVAIGAMFGCASNPPATTENVGALAGDTLWTSPASNGQQVVLGRLLFFDPRLSRDGQAACIGCHSLTKFGVDGKPAGITLSAPGAVMNAPSVFNTQAHIALFWSRPITADSAHAALSTGAVTVTMTTTSERALLDTLGRVPRYVELFRSAFPGDPQPISLKNVAEAIETFERGLVSSTRWDKFLAGDASALTLEEKLGLRVFIKSGCVACHTGPQVGGTMFQQVGIAYPWPKAKKQGQGAAADSPMERLVLHVPSLKNIAETAPYFRSGETSNLHAAIRLMGHHQLGIELSNEDVDAIAAWMRALSADVDPAYIKPPELPLGS